ncbi:hypothetical protein [Amycolatopsis sp. NPDC004079]|uniref:hypothetical protein n=1 Tax=Amycolatopsis sp. NPDC004079 TaxID=3154549 RepID=UPI0033B1864E
MPTATPIALAELGKPLRLKTWEAIKIDELFEPVIKSWMDHAGTQAELDELDNALKNVREHKQQMWDLLWELQTVA